MYHNPIFVIFLIFLVIPAGMVLFVKPTDGQLMPPLNDSCKVSNLSQISMIDSWDNQNNAYGITMDLDGFVYNVSPNAYSIQKMDGQTGKVLGNWEFPPNDGYGHWADISLDQSGDIYVTDGDEGKLLKFDNNGKLVQSYVPLKDSFFPTGIDTDSKGNIYITNGPTAEIFKLNSKGVLLETWFGGSYKIPWWAPKDIAIDSFDNVYVSSTAQHMIFKFDSNGNYITSWGGQGTKEGLLNRPTGIAVDCMNNVYVADHFSGIARIQKFSHNGQFIDSLESKTREGLDNESIVHLGVATDLKGNVFLADGFIQEIRKFGPPPSDIDKDGIPDLDDICPNDPTNTCNLKPEIIGYDARDVDRLILHDGWLSHDSISEWDGISGNGLVKGERIAIHIENNSPQKINLSEFWIGDIEYIYQQSSTLPQNNDDSSSPRYWVVLKGDYLGPAITSTIKIPELPAFQKATIVAELPAAAPLGRDMDIMIQTSDGAKIVGTIVTGQATEPSRVYYPDSDASSNNSEELEAKANFNNLMGATLERHGSSIVFPNDFDSYFPTIQTIIQRLDNGNIIPPNQYRLEKFAYDDGEEIILTEKLVIDIENEEEFLAVFQLDYASYFVPFSIGNLWVDDNFIEKNIQSALDSCSQTNEPPIFCSFSKEELKNRVLQKIGTHTIVESTAIKKISTLDGNSSFDDPDKIAKLLPTEHQEKQESIQKILYSLSESLNEIESMDYLPLASAQTGDGNKASFLNGFTIGYGFEKSWYYEFDVLEMVPIAVDAHIETGLGIGLRIPIEVVLGIQSSETQKFNVDYIVNTQNWSERDYEEVLGFGKGFGGNEFKVYLGPQINLDVLLFDESAYSFSEGIITTPEAGDFTPPLDNSQTNREITSYTLDCELINALCFDLPTLGTVGLHLGTRVDLSGEQVTITSQPINSPQRGHEVSLHFSGQKSSYQYDVSNSNRLIGAEISNLQYHSDLHFIPRAMIDADIILGWLLPFDLSTGWIDFPEILFEEIVFEKHEGTTGHAQILSTSSRHSNENPDETTIKTHVNLNIPQGTAVPGCEETNECYVPYEITVAAGGEVTWHNDDSAAHTVTAGTPADGPSGVFDSSLFMAGTTFSQKFKDVGAFPYFCMVHPWMTGVVKVQAGVNTNAEFNGSPSAVGMLSDGTKVSVWASEPIAGERMEIKIEFEDSEHVNHDIRVIQNGDRVLYDKGAHHHQGSGTHETVPLRSSDSVDIMITFQGYGIDNPKIGPIGETVQFSNVVPEFGTITMAILGVAIITMVILTSRSKNILGNI